MNRNCGGHCSRHCRCWHESSLCGYDYQYDYLYNHLVAVAAAVGFGAGVSVLSPGETLPTLSGARLALSLGRLAAGSGDSTIVIRGQTRGCPMLLVSVTST